MAEDNVIKGPWIKDSGEDGYSFQHQETVDNRERLSDPQVICTDCSFSVDFRSHLARLFRKPSSEDLLCSAIDLRKIEHPVTGEAAYMDEHTVILSMTGNNPHPYCQAINLIGTCKRFRSNLRYKK